MSVVFIVVPIALLASAAAVAAFVWAIRRGQLDDLTTPAYRMLEDERGPTAPRPSPARDAADLRSSPSSADPVTPS